MAMRTKANISLLLLGMLFLAAAIGRYYAPDVWWLKMLMYVAEAGLVGGLADLFAVTVLFRHPFGWRWVPHTAIIPRNRDKLVDGVAIMVEEQLLSKGMLMDKIKQYNLVDAVIGWVDRGISRKELSLQGWKLAASLAGRLDAAALSVELDKRARQKLKSLNLSPYAGAALKWMLNNSSLNGWLDSIVDYAAEKASSQETKAMIRKLLEGEKEKFVNEGGTLARWFKAAIVDIAEAADALNLEEAADTLHRDLLKLMEELKDPQHELRVLLVGKLHELADSLRESEDMAASVAAWKNELLEQLSLQPAIEALLGQIRKLFVSMDEQEGDLRTERSIGREDVKRWVMALASSWWKSFKHDSGTKQLLERYVQQFAARVLETEHALVGTVVRRTLDSFTEQRLVHFIESKVDTDLQRIRLNGAFIGAVVGAVLYILLHGVYAPLLELINR